MAKKRVHELAKQYSMPLPEVLKRLNAYGLDVKAAATAVDEKLADAALTGKPEPGQGGAGQRRPTRSSLQGERAPGSAGGVRRVVIDSQASRRPGGPGGP